jgi:hypothetical protein
VIERTPEKQRQQLLRNLKARAAAAHRAQLSEPPGEVQFVQGGQLVYAELLGFLQQRLSNLDSLLSKRVLPEQGVLGL